MGEVKRHPDEFVRLLDYVVPNITRKIGAIDLAYSVGLVNKSCPHPFAMHWVGAAYRWEKKVHTEDIITAEFLKGKSEEEARVAAKESHQVKLDEIQAEIVKNRESLEQAFAEFEKLGLRQAYLQMLDRQQDAMRDLCADPGGNEAIAEVQSA